MITSRRRFMVILGSALPSALQAQSQEAVPSFLRVGERFLKGAELEKPSNLARRTILINEGWPDPYVDEDRRVVVIPAGSPEVMARMLADTLTRIDLKHPPNRAPPRARVGERFPEKQEVQLSASDRNYMLANELILLVNVSTSGPYFDRARRVIGVAPAASEPVTLQLAQMLATLRHGVVHPSDDSKLPPFVNPRLRPMTFEDPLLGSRK